MLLGYIVNFKLVNVRFPRKSGREDKISKKGR